MARGRKTGGGSRKGSPNKRTIEARRVAMWSIAEAVVTLAELVHRFNDEEAAMGAALKLLHGAAVKLMMKHEGTPGEYRYQRPRPSPMIPVPAPGGDRRP